MSEQEPSSIGLTELAGENPVHFRVEYFGPNPLNSMLPSGSLLLSIRFENGRATNFGLTPRWVVGVKGALQEAFASETLFWTNLVEPNAPMLPPKRDDSNLHRFIHAVRDEQIVAEDEG